MKDEKEYATIKGLDNPQEQGPQAQQYTPSFNDSAGLDSYDSLDEDTPFDPVGIVDNQAAKDQREKTAMVKKEDEAKATLVMALDQYESMIMVMGHARFKLDTDVKEHCAQQLVPLALKYFPEGFDLGKLFGKYGPEIMASIAIFTLGKSTMHSVRELKAEDMAIAREKNVKKAAQQPQPQPVKESGALPVSETDKDE